jgi:hypothetical protein
MGLKMETFFPKGTQPLKGGALFKKTLKPIISRT